MAEKEKDKPQAVNFLVNYIKAGFSLINIVSAEETRAEKEILEACKATGRGIKIWSGTTGFMGPDGKQTDTMEDPTGALKKIYAANEPKTVYIFRDLHLYFGGQGHARIVRFLRDIARDFKQQSRTLFLVSPVQKVPPELDRDMTVIDFSLPDEHTLGVVWDALMEDNPQPHLTEDDRDMIVQAARGLTTNEAENAYSKALIEASAIKDLKLRPKIHTLVMKEKALAVKKNGILEYFDTKTTLDDIGGLANLKKWLQIRRGAFGKKARAYGLPIPKGVLFVGTPGCGKSLGAKAVASALGVPLIRFDISKVFAGLVGASEAQMRSALGTIDAIGNCVVWMDELEKALSGMGGGGSNDNGVSNRVFGAFLTWMQEKTTPSFVCATVNRIDGLPPELYRKGRFDELFYVPPPTAKEREEIFQIHIRKRGRKPENFNLAACVKKTHGFSGAEIEEAVVSAMFNAFSKEKNGEPSEFTDLHIEFACGNIKPLSESRGDELKEMVKWAQNNAVNASAENEKDVSAGRKLDLGA